MRNSSLPPRSARCFLDVPLCSGSLFRGCHNSPRQGCAAILLLKPASYISQLRRFRVLAAFFAEAERERAERWLATRFECLDNAPLDAERRLSRLSARFVARDRV